ncbi:MAG TPA: TonB-dependent receptor [Gemmatimonadaceae bacterium]|nr:TonB-dependent receptor [Gemmatimonadaceae bacterium]
MPPPGSEVPIPPKPKTDSAAPKPDTIKPRFGRGQKVRTADVGPQYSWNREQLFASGALNLGELLERVPGAIMFRTGWLNSQKFIAVNGSLTSVSVYYDGIKLDNLNTRTAPVLDLNEIQLWTLEKVTVERWGTELRVHVSSWQADRTQPSTRVDVFTGDEDTNIYRGFYGKRFSNGGALQFGGQQFNSTPPRFGGGGDALSVLARVGIARKRWSVDGFANRTTSTRVIQPTFGAFGGLSIPGYQATHSLAYLRVAVGDTTGPWAQVSASGRRLNENSKRVLVAEALAQRLLADTVDTTRTEQQYNLSAGLNRAPLAVSVNERIRRVSGVTTSDPSARVNLDWRYGLITLHAEHDGFSKKNRADALVQFTPTSSIAVTGNVSRIMSTSDAPGADPDILAARVEGGVRLFGPWIVGGFMTRDTAILQPLRAIDTAYIAQPAGRRTGTYVGVRGPVYKSLNADIIATQWAIADEYRPKYQVRAELNVNTRWLSRFPSGNFGVNAALVSDYRSSVRFPTATGDRIAESSTVFSGLLEIRILKAVISYQVRNLAGLTYQIIPDFYMPRVINLYGVRWDFVN